MQVQINEKYNVSALLLIHILVYTEITSDGTQLLLIKEPNCPYKS